jgi:uncharacterized protein with HEPN domain
MGNKIIIYKQKVSDNLKECIKHLERLNNAFNELSKKFDFPLSENNYQEIVSDVYKLALSDQIIYRFSKLQDAMGAKMFKSVLLYQGENIDKPFLDILNQLEKMGVVNVDQWFELRDLRNEIAHDYEDKEITAVEILNAIYNAKDELNEILNSVKQILLI